MILRILVIFWLLGIYSCLWSKVIRVGSFQFDVQAFNTWGKEIKLFAGSGRIDGHTAFIGIRIPGYRPTHTMVHLSENQNFYPVRIEVKDPLVQVFLRTKQGDEIDSQVFLLNEIGDPDEYRFEAEIKAWGFSNFTPWDVDIRINKRVLERAFVALRGYGYGRIVEISFPRNNLLEYSNEIEILVPKDSLKSAPESLRKRQLRFQQIHNLSTMARE